MFILKLIVKCFLVYMINGGDTILVSSNYVECCKYTSRNRGDSYRIEKERWQSWWKASDDIADKILFSFVLSLPWDSMYFSIVNCYQKYLQQITKGMYHHFICVSN